MIPMTRPRTAMHAPADLLLPEPKYAEKIPATSMTKANAKTTRVRKAIRVNSMS